MVESDWKVASFEACYGEYGHGLILKVKGTVVVRAGATGGGAELQNALNSRQVAIDVQGEFHMKAMASLFLPFAAGGATWKIDGDAAATSSSARPFELTLPLGTNGQLSHATLRKQLEEQIGKGDPFLCLCVLDGSLQSCYMQVVTRPSLILSSLASSGVSSAMAAAGPGFPPYRPSFFATTRYRVLRWSVWPMVTLFVVWSLLFPQPRAVMVVRYSGYVMARLLSNKTFSDEVPPHPKNIFQAFHMGVIYDKYVSSNESEEYRKELQRLLLRPTAVTHEQMMNLPAMMEEYSDGNGVVARVYGFFTFVNVIWLVAIIGISVSIGPAFVVLLQPVYRFVKKIWNYVVTQIVIPVLLRCHSWGLIEMLLYLTGYDVVISAVKIIHTDYAFMIAFSGLVFFLLCFAYSSFLHGLSIWMQLDGAGKQSVVNYVQVWLLLLLAPQAVTMQSSLFGYFAFAILYSLMGFSVWCFGLCYFIGFRNGESLIRIMVTSFLILTVATACRISHVDRRHQELFRPFQQPATVFGSVTFFLALLIFSSLWVPVKSPLSYGARNTLMAASLLVFGGLGFVFTLHGVANTAVVFLVLWLMEKFLEVNVQAKTHAMVIVLLFSIIIYFIALQLHSHPEFIVAILS